MINLTTNKKESFAKKKKKRVFNYFLKLFWFKLLRRHASLHLFFLLSLYEIKRIVIHCYAN